MEFEISSKRDCRWIKAAIEGERSQNPNAKVGITSGCFDLLHYLHLVYFRRCRRKCDVLIVGVDSDDMVKQFKGDTRPLIPEHQRLAMVSAVNVVDASFIMGRVEDLDTAIDKFGIDYIFKNQDYQGEDCVGADKAELITVPDVNIPDSTSKIIEAASKALNK